MSQALLSLRLNRLIEDALGFKYYVYTLSDMSGTIFYVGKGSRGRLYEHEKAVRKGLIPNNNQKLYERIRQILDNEEWITYNVVYRTDDESEAFRFEKELIFELRGQLTNIVVPSLRKDPSFYNFIKAVKFKDEKE